jgi:hypothetical protein
MSQNFRCQAPHIQTSGYQVRGGRRRVCGILDKHETHMYDSPVC